MPARTLVRWRVLCFGENFMSDTYTKAGAKALAEKIRSYWSARRKWVNVWTEEIQYERSPGDTRSMHIVKSDLLNGLPRPGSELARAA